MSEYLFLCSIGPVQSFISQARKTQDLYSGSLILSDLIDKAIKKLDTPDGLIFPHPKIESKPNRFIALISTDDPKRFGERIEKTVRDEFKALAHNALKENGVADNHPNFDSQIENFLEVYWVAVPYDGNYLLKYGEIERSLGAVKNIRAFSQLDEQGRKCALCGERNVLYYKPLDAKDKKANILNPILIKEFQFIKGEGLCAVCCVKRFYEKKSFPSTARIALMHTIYQIRRNPEGYVWWDQYITKFQDAHFEDQFYYEENLTESYFKKYDLEKFTDQLHCIQKSREKIRDFAKTKNLKLSKYYAVVVFDGDSMGKWLSGETIKDKQHLKEFHQTLSGLLGEFAEFSKNYLTDPLGKAVYTGGDDFLGFVNLNHLFDVLDKLRKEFEIKVNNPLAKEFPFKSSDDRITFSAGVAIAHYKMPLSIVLERARAMEKQAKSVNGKDAVGFALLKHSGNISETVFKWNYDSENTMELMKDVKHALKNWISDKFMYSLREEFLHLFDEETGIEPDIVEAEIYRLMARRKRKTDISEEEIKALRDRLVNLFGQLKNIDCSDLSNFLSFLEVCNFIARETNAKEANHETP